MQRDQIFKLKKSLILTFLNSRHFDFTIKIFIQVRRSINGLAIVFKRHLFTCLILFYLYDYDNIKVVA